jgi:hypothetical protein
MPSPDATLTELITELQTVAITEFAAYGIDSTDRAHDRLPEQINNLYPQILFWMGDEGTEWDYQTVNNRTIGGSTNTQIEEMHHIEGFVVVGSRESALPDMEYEARTWPRRLLLGFLKHSQLGGKVTRLRVLRAIPNVKRIGDANYVGVSFWLYLRSWPRPDVGM